MDLILTYFSLFLRARDVRDSLLEKHPEIKDKLLYINYKADRLTIVEKQQFYAENKEVPPTPELLTNSNEEELTKCQAKEVEKTDQPEVSSEPASQQEEGKPSKKSKEVVEEVEEATKDPAPAESEGIYEGCGSFVKL